MECMWKAMESIGGQGTPFHFQLPSSPAKRSFLPEGFGAIALRKVRFRNPHTPTPVPVGNEPSGLSFEAETPRIEIQRTKRVYSPPQLLIGPTLWAAM
jgi:hypothetical protein